MGLYNVLSHTKDTSKIVLITAIKNAKHILIVDEKKCYVDDELKNIPVDRFNFDEVGIQKIDDEEYFIDLISKQTNLIVCGGGHVAQALVKIARMLSFNIIALEDRLSFARAMKIAGADEVIYEEFTDGIEKVSGSPNTYFAILTRGHRYDLECLNSILRKPFAYIGMLSSKYRASTTKKKLVESGFDKDIVDKLNAPIGLNINAKTPEEIAVSILSEIIQVKNQNVCSSDFPKEIITAISEENMPKILCTIIRAKGSTPRDAGTKMLVLEDGNILGTIGGGCMEFEVRNKALELIGTKEPKIIKIDMTGRITDIENDGMACGGIIDVLLEPIL